MHDWGVMLFMGNVELNESIYAIIQTVRTYFHNITDFFIF